MSGRRLFKSLFLSYVWIALVAVIAVGWYGERTARQTCLDRTEEDLEARARLSQRAIVESLARGPAAVDEVCKALGAASGTRITVILPDGRVVGDTEADPTTMDNHKDRPEVRAAISGGVGQSTRTSPTVKEELMYVAVPAYRDGALTAIVRTAIPVTEIHAIYDAIRWRILLAVLGVAAVLAAVSLWVSSRIARPLREMGAGAERFARGEFAHRLPRSGTLELNVLSRALNEMAEQLDERIRTMKCQRNELEAVLSSMQEGVLAVDNAGVIINVNQMAATLLGANDAGQLRGKVVQEVVRKAGLLEFVETSLASTSPVEDSIRVFADEDRWLHVHGTMLQDATNQIIGTLIVLHDVTRLRHLEDVRRDFVANVSHELRTPITSIKGFVETLIDGAYEDRENARRFLEII
ncbi:MAG: cell wall metabolism sensor histidine kinase WalK, partial [Planctomycetes bacterium]|nr:cell wall metabolism sensor histidine kinase WalK [Planctomycetota bacterium]